MVYSPEVDLIVIEPVERKAFHERLAELAPTDCPNPEVLLEPARTLAASTPSRVIRAIDDLKAEVGPAAIVIRSLLPATPLPATPPHWRQSPALPGIDLVLLSTGLLLGEPFAWATQQDARLIFDVLPIRGLEMEQVSASSETELSWHTEDAFHNFRGDFLVLLCLRNPSGVETTFCDAGALSHLPLSTRKVLAQTRFRILPDNSHTDAFNTAVEKSAFDTLHHRVDGLRTSIIDDAEHPNHLRVDPDFTLVDEMDTEAASALLDARLLIDSFAYGIALMPGDICVIDNRRAVHGRRPFTARYDGQDRWIRRINVVSSLDRALEAGVCTNRTFS